MNRFTLLRPRRVVATLLGCTMAFGVYAQQTPITGQMGAPGASSGTANTPVEAAPATPMAAAPATVGADASTHVGSVTRQLFAMQSLGTDAGRALPIPGPEASASYQRYLKSFTHPIPEFYETTVSKNANGASGTTGSP